MVYFTTINHGRLHGDRKTIKWSLSPPSAAADLAVTETPENGPCYRHLPWETSQWKKDEKIIHTIAICSGRHHSDRKDQKMAYATRSATAYLTVTSERPEIGPCHCHPLREASRWQKDQKMVHASAIHHRRSHSDITIRKWSMSPPSAATDLKWQNDQKMVHATAIHRGRPHGDKRPENGPCHWYPLRQASWWKKDQKITGMLYLEAGINGRYFALTKTAVHCSCERLYELRRV